MAPAGGVNDSMGLADGVNDWIVLADVDKGCQALAGGVNDSMTLADGIKGYIAFNRGWCKRLHAYASNLYQPKYIYF